MMTLTQHLDSMRHALGKTPNSKHRLIDSFNQAGRALFAHHEWTWKNRGPETLVIPAGASQIPLPEDFGQVVDVSVNNSTVFDVQLVSVPAIMQFRANLGYESQRMYLAFRTGSPQATLTTPANLPKVAEVYPVQDSERTDVSIFYTAEWFDMDETTHDQAVPPIPAMWERALMLWARKNAVEIENQEQAPESGPLARELEMLIGYDAGTQPNMGRPLNRVRRNHDIARRPHGLIGPY